MEFTFELSWPALIFFMTIIGILIDKKEPKKINNIEIANSQKTVKEYHEYIEKFLKETIEVNQNLSTENESLKKRVHSMETRSMNNKMVKK